LPTQFSLNWTDNVGLSGYVFETNNSGTPTNDSWVDFENQTGDAIFIDGFESGDFSKWTGTDISGASLTVSSSQPYSGAYSLYLDATNEGHGLVYKNITSISTAYYRSYIYLSSVQTFQNMFFMRFTNPIISRCFGVGITTDRNLTIEYYTSSWQTATSATKLNLDTYYSVEVLWDYANNQIKVWLNGIQVDDLTQSSVSLYGQVYQALAGGEGSQGGELYYGGKFYLDNTVVSSDYIGSYNSWSNITKTLNTTVGLPIGWRVYANDTSDNWNTSQTYELTTTDSGQCQIMINNATIPYTITQNNTYYCLAEDIGWGGVNGTIFASGVQNSTLDCRGYNIDSNDTSNTYGVYLTGSSIKNNTVKNCNVIDFEIGIRLLEGPVNNTLINNTVTNNSRGIFITGSSNNTIFNNTADNNTYQGIYTYSNNNNNFTNNIIYTRLLQQHYIQQYSL
jgi:parallel beta-helix repeat protein